MREPLVSVIILNLNGKSFLADCLDSLGKQSFKDFETIIVDNGSNDGSVKMIKEIYSDSKIIQNPKNLGFAEANNQGLKIAKGKYIVTLNNDTVFDKEWLGAIVEAAEKSDKHTGMFASKVLSAHEPKKIDSAGINICLDGMSKGRGRGEEDLGQYDQSGEVLLPSACSALYKKEMIEEIGFFDQDFFAYCEDTDLGLRGRIAGWRAILVPKSVVYHKYSSTGGKYSSFKARLVERNHAFVVIKNFPLELVLAFPFLTIYRFLIQVYAVLFKKGATSEFIDKYSLAEAIKVVLQSYGEIFLSMPALLRKRSSLQKKRKIGREEFYQLLKNFRLPIGDLVFQK